MSCVTRSPLSAAAFGAIGVGRPPRFASPQALYSAFLNSPGGREAGSWTPAITPDVSLDTPALDTASCRAGGLSETESEFVVPVVCGVPVPVRCP